MIPVPDIGHVYPKTGLDADIRFDTTPRFVSEGSMYLDGTNDRLDCDGATWASTGAWTIACWIKCTGTSTTTQLIMSATDGSNTLDLYASGGASANVQLNDGNSGQNIASNALLFDGAWHHLALTCGAGGGATATLYFDGQSQGTITCTCDDLSSASTLHIGANTAGASTLAGNLAHFGIWESALSQASIRKLMTATTYAQVITKSGATPVDYWLLEADGTASVGQDGTLTNGAVIVGDRAHLPSGYDLTGNQLNAVPFSGRAWVGDGSADYCEAPGSTDTIMTGGTFSTSFWAKTSSNTEQTVMAMIGTYGWQIAAVFQTDPAQWKFQILDDSGWETIYAKETDANTPSKLDDGQWRFIVATCDSGAMRFYLNGVMDADTDTANTGVSYPDIATVLHIGSNKVDGDKFNGSLADLKIWNIALSQAQVDELFANREQILPTGASSTNLKAWYPLNDYDVSGTNSLDGLYMADASQYNNPAKCISGIMEFSQPGIPQMGLRSSSSTVAFDGTDDKFTVANHSDFDFGSGNWTWSFYTQYWGASYDGLMSAQNNYRIAWRNNDTTVGVEGDGSSVDQSLGSAQTGKWAHIVLSKSSTTLTYYINGSSAGTQTFDQDFDTGGNDLKFGSNQDGAGNWYQGLIQHAAVWSSALSAAEVIAIYNSGSPGSFDLAADSGDYSSSGNCKGWWRFDNAKTAQDLTANNRDATAAGNPNIVTIPEGTTAGLTTMGTVDNKRPWNGMAGLSVYQSQYNVLMGNTAELPHIALGTNAWTISLWFKIRKSAAVDNGRIFDFYDGKGVVAHVQDADEFKIYLKGASGTPTAAQPTLTDAQMYDTWVHLCVRRELAATFSFVYHPLDQAAVTISDSTGTDAGSMTPDNNIPFVLGGVAVSTNHRGTNSGAAIADVRIWDAEAISDAQVDALYESGARFLRST